MHMLKTILKVTTTDASPLKTIWRPLYENLYTSHHTLHNVRDSSALRDEKKYHRFISGRELSTAATTKSLSQNNGTDLVCSSALRLLHASGVHMQQGVHYSYITDMHRPARALGPR